MRYYRKLFKLQCGHCSQIYFGASIAKSLRTLLKNLLSNYYHVNNKLANHMKLVDEQMWVITEIKEYPYYISKIDLYNEKQKLIEKYDTINNGFNSKHEYMIPCIHQNLKSNCSVCLIKKKCKHEKYMHQCKKCDARKYCLHSKRKTSCKICNPIFCKICKKIYNKYVFKTHCNTKKHILLKRTSNILNI